MTLKENEGWKKWEESRMRKEIGSRMKHSHRRQT